MPTHPLPDGFTVSHVLLSADGSRCRYLASDGPTTRIFVNGVELGSFAKKSGHAFNLASSADLAHHAWVNKSGRTAEVVTAGGARFGPFAEVRLLGDAFTRGRLRFTAQRGKETFVHFGDQVLGPFAEVGDQKVDERGTIAFAFRRGRRWFVWIDGRESGPFEGFPYGPPQHRKRAAPRFGRLADGRPVVLCGAGKHFALHVGEEEQLLRHDTANVAVGGSTILLECGRDPTSVIRDGVVLATVDTVRTIRNTIAPGGGHVGFAFDHDSFAGFYLEGERSEGFGYTDGPWWSDDGAHVAWGRGEEEPTFVVDGEPHAQPHAIDWEQGGDFGFGPDGRFHAVLRDPDADQRFLSADKELHGPFDELITSRASRAAISTSENGELAFVRRTGDELVLRARGRERGPLVRGRYFDWTLNGRDEIVVACASGEGREVRVETFAF
jgi:hypothetical protein